MKKLTILLLVALNFSLEGSAQQAPESNKTAFSEQALKQPLFDLEGNQINAGTILSFNHGKNVLLYIWASWCPDCLEGFPQLFELRKKNPDLHVVFFSLDREEANWKNSIEKFGLEGEHYWFRTGRSNDFTDYVELNWIPRYLLLDRKGQIVKYYTVKAEDPELQQAIDRLDRPHAL